MVWAPASLRLARRNSSGAGAERQVVRSAGAEQYKNDGLPRSLHFLIQISLGLLINLTYVENPLPRAAAQTI